MTSPSASPAPSNAAPIPAQPPGLVVRRDIRRTLRTSLLLLGAAVLLLFWVPAVIVLLRPEAAYFTNGILWSALVATVVVLLAGGAATLGLARRGAVLLTADADGVRIPGGRRRPALEARWEDLLLVRLVGATDPALAFYPRHRDTDPADPVVAEPELDLSEPEFLRPLDFTADPPPAMRAPDRAVYERIAPLAPQQPEVTPVEPKPAPGEVLHGTPYVVPLVRTRPAVPDVLRALTRLSAGRVRLD